MKCALDFFCLLLSSVSSSDLLCLVLLLRRSLGTDRIVTSEAKAVTPNCLTAEATQKKSALDFF